MTNREHVQNLMRQIGPQLDLEAVSEFEDENLWVLTFDEATRIEVDLDDTFGKLVLSGSIGPIEEGIEARLYPLLLQFNYVWEQTGGARMALAGPGGNLVMAIDVPIAGLEFPLLQSVVTNLAAQTQNWREVLRGMTSGPPRDAPTVAQEDAQFLASSLKV